MLRAAVINGSLFTGAGRRPKGLPGSTYAHMQLWQIVFPISRACESDASARGGLTRAQRLERSKCSMVSLGVPCEGRWKAG